MIFISEHISYKEVVRSRIATQFNIDNNPSNLQLVFVRLIANNIFEPLRRWAGCKIYISSFFRSKILNKAITFSSKISDHCIESDSVAIDLDADVFKKITNAQIFYFIEKNLVFDKLIWEYGDEQNPAWVHVSLKNSDNRKIKLRAIIEDGETKYIKL